MGDDSAAEGCPFCSILSGKLDGIVVFREEKTACILDKSPVFPGHALIIPSKHYALLEDVPDNVLADMQLRAKMLSSAMESSLGCDGTLMILNNKVSQSVQHVHMHVIPRKFGDGLKHFMWPRRRYSSRQEMESIAEGISKAYKFIKR
jgi:histidine triad (HIT) family protein